MLKNTIYRFCGLAGILFLLSSLPSYSAAEMLFRWAFIKHHDQAPDQVLDFSKPPLVKSGDELRIFLEPLSNAYIYLYLYDSGKKLSLIFPADFAVFASDDYSGHAKYIPQRGNWFTVEDPTGTERFYLLASERRLDSLEQLTRDYYADVNAGSKAALLTEIKSLRKKHSHLTAEAETGVSIAGTIKSFRGIASNTPVDGRIEAIEVRARHFYGKTIRLKHE